MIIAKRIKLNLVGEIISFVILVVIIFGFLGLSIYWESTVWITLCIIIAITLTIFGIINLRNIYINNHSPSILIKFKDNRFTICDKFTSITFSKEDLIDMDYKNKKFYLYTLYLYYSSEYNYGTVVLYLKSDNSIEEYYKLTLKNVANPDKVFEKISHICEWDTIKE